LIHDVGYMGQGLTGHPAAIVICAQITSYVKRFIRGFNMDDVDISMDVNRKVGRQSLSDRAIEKARIILQQHEAGPLGDDIQTTLDAMRKQAVAELEGISFES